MKSIYTIVVTFNASQWIEKCLDSIISSSVKSHIIVIDNGSYDDTCKIIERKFPEAELIRTHQNLGFGKGNNIGLKRALEDEADYVFLLNQDAYLQERTLSTLMEISKDAGDFAILSPVHLDGQGARLEMKFEEYAGPLNTPGFLSDLYTDATSEIYVTDFVNAAAWFIPVAKLKRVGGFNPVYFHYGEDEDFVHRCRFFNFKVGIVPEARIYHDKIYNIEEIKTDLRRQVALDLVSLTNVNQSFRSAFVLFLKTTLDRLGTNLIFRQFREFRRRFTGMFRIIGMVRRIKRARKLARKGGAFL